MLIEDGDFFTEFPDTGAGFLFGNQNINVVFFHLRLPLADEDVAILTKKD
ncbi:hypothetical protein CF65_00140 [Aggregatibacter actinomycetemcomitans HK1651]|nr:hypothetical protein CF65_00140 [Aggregatibacter actinomycetemcomitans HK1651]